MLNQQLVSVPVQVCCCLRCGLAELLLCVVGDEISVQECDVRPGQIRPELCGADKSWRVSAHSRSYLPWMSSRASQCSCFLNRIWVEIQIFSRFGLKLEEGKRCEEFKCRRI